MDRLKAIAVGGLAVLMVLILPLTTLAITVAGTNYNDSMYSPTSFFDGVAAIDIRYDPGTGPTWTHATGALLNTPSSPGLYVLTAAHPLTDTSGNWNYIQVKMTFYGGGSTEYQGVQFFKPGQWNGDFTHGGDIAVIKLGSAVSGITGYDMLRDDNWGYSGVNFVGGVATIAGYGKGGTGATGFDPISAFGTLRVGQNKFDALWPYQGLPFGYDFDDGNAPHDCFGYFFGINDTGQGLLEVLIAAGDSGGPSFVEVGGVELLAGIHSFGNRFQLASGGFFDWSDNINSSFGEVAGDTRVGAFDVWIDDQIGSKVPEPCTMILLGSGLLGLWGFRKKFKR